MKRGIGAIANACLALGLLANAVRAEQELSPRAKSEIQALLQEKNSRTAAEQKLHSSLLFAYRQHKGRAPVPGLGHALPQAAARAGVDAEDRVIVDMQATVSESLLAAVRGLGGQVLSSHPAFRTFRARLPVDRLADLASRPDVLAIAPRARAWTNAGSVTSQGDIAHAAAAFRAAYGVDGTGVRVGVLSDGVDSVAARQATGDLGPVTIVPGQAGSGDEGTAMLEVVHDLAPGAELFFATAFDGVGSFAANIVALRATYGCDIIIDDVTYFDEGAFQDGPIAQAVNAVSADGALFFSSAGNSGNLTDATSGTWEGDFLDSGTTIGVLPGGAAIHSFNGLTGGSAAKSDPLTKSSGFITLKWSDPLGASTNDYDLFRLDSTLSTVLDASTNRQSGAGWDPYEEIFPGSAGDAIVVVLHSGVPRALHLDTNRGRLTLRTNGAIVGHNGAAGALSVAAVDVARASGGAFTAGSASPVERYSSDGPRRMFYTSAGNPIVPNNVLFATHGGQALAKPDLAAADCIHTSTPGYLTFCGTSAAAPHAGALAALLKSLPSAPSTSEVKTALLGTTLDIMAPGRDGDSGKGIGMALSGAAAGVPFGSFDTPSDNATGIQGAIPLTGWALDNSAVRRLELWRDPVPGDPPPAPNGQIYIGNATFAEGARSDIQTLFSSYPEADRAGWGYMLLTNALPNVMSGASSGGVGTFTLHAYVYALDGEVAALPTRTITCDNLSGTLPFGAIDTPTPGQTVSGTIQSFGWALTPPPGLIPTDGSTIVLYIDGLPRGTVLYDFHRADVEGMFPGYGNSSNGHGPIGVFAIDTTTLANGVHTIAWSVTDNLGRASGIGSRYFSVVN